MSLPITNGTPSGKNTIPKADAQSTKPSYYIVIPPPNVAGTLHMGHALVNTLQDIFDSLEAHVRF